MPKRALSLIQWSNSAHAYEYVGSESPILGETILESDVWFTWLQDISSFAFRSQSGVHYTVRKEQVQHNGPYWYGYRSFRGRTIKRYVGRTADLSLARLEEVSERFTNPPPSDIAPSIQPSSPLTSAPLLTSKFHPPRLPLALVNRPHLFARLDAWRSQKLTLLWAPAGFGKTTLVNSWQRKQKASRNAPHIAWISLEAKDNDPALFWRSIITACQAWQPGLGETALLHLQQVSLLQMPVVSVPLEVPLTLFLNDLANQMSDGVFLVDDYHVIVDPRIHQSLVFFIDHLPAHLHVMILTRNEAPLPLVQWRARGDLQEISRTDLRFSLKETASFLQDTTASAFSEKTITELDILLQGWAAGLRLLVLAGRMTQSGIEHHLALLYKEQHTDSFRRQLLDYFVSEVLSAQPEELQHFLLQTCELPRLTGLLCDTVTGRQNSMALLETLERAGLFLEALDEVEPWYRPSSLFADALRIEARQHVGEEALRAISRRAGHWYEQHALAEEAIEVALRVHDMERAGTLIERIGTSGQRIDLQVLRGWLEQLPDTILDAHPALCFYFAVTLQFHGEQAFPPQTIKGRIEALLQRAEEGWRSRGKPIWIGLVVAFRALITSLQESSPTAAGEHATQALALLPIGGSDDDVNIRPAILEWRIICLGIVGSAAMHQGCFDEACRFLREALAYSQEGANQQFLGEINLRLGAVYMALGDLHQAGEFYQQALTVGRLQEKHEDSVRALLGLAQLFFEWNDLEGSAQHTNEARELIQAMAQDGCERVAYHQALLSAARGERAAASLQLATLLARLQATSTQDAHELIPEALALQARLYLAADDHLAAQRTLALLACSEQELSFTQQMMMNILRIRLQLALGETNNAVHLLEQLLSLAQEKRHGRSQIEIQILLALTQAIRKQKGLARTWLQKALSLAHTEGFLCVFLAEGEPLIGLLRSLLPGIREKALRAYGQSILYSLARPGEKPSLSLSLAFEELPLEPLSPQEQRVLRGLCAGRSNREIASELVISVNTVKDHVKNLYQKLGVRSRLEAYEAARHLKQF